jgi:hypothetical protein
MTKDGNGNMQQGEMRTAVGQQEDPCNKTYVLVGKAAAFVEVDGEDSHNDNCL